MIEYVQEFNARFGLPIGNDDQLKDAATQNYRLGFLAEELDELAQALEDGDRVGAFDALLDLVYVAQGTALFMGINPEQWNAGMKAVHQANMSKVRAASKDSSKRNSAFDVVKPDYWVGPEETLKDILSAPNQLRSL